MLQLGNENGPGLHAAFRVRHQELLVDRYHFAWCSNTAAQFHDAAGGLTALGDERPPLKGLFHVFQADDAGLFLSCPLQADPR
ncbi:hypothetical protein D9M71_732230 [compost metagenome]